eukprot:4154299-Pleurochrysis_carterae.AAC.1
MYRLPPPRLPACAHAFLALAAALHLALALTHPIPPPCPPPMAARGGGALPQPHLVGDEDAPAVTQGEEHAVALRAQHRFKRAGGGVGV